VLSYEGRLYKNIIKISIDYVSYVHATSSFICVSVYQARVLKAASQQQVREENKNGGSNNKYEAMQGTHVSIHTNIEGT